MEEGSEVLRRLFQEEFSKMVAVISNRFGLRMIEVAEDIVSDTFTAAIENWEVRGIPVNPAAWLYAVARQKALYYFRRNRIFEEKVVPELNSREETGPGMDELDFGMDSIRDSQLRMVFAICNPVIASEAQIGLALRILCGFGIGEIAEAFFTNKETINKRLLRAKEKLRAGQVNLELPPGPEIVSRLDNVLHVIYLLFSEGYYSATQNQMLRKDLCLEALRLGLMLRDYGRTNLPKTNALIALMCLHASRFDARKAKGFDQVLYEDQDQTLWDQSLIQKGRHFLELSLQGNQISSYHLEAMIALWHCQKEDSPEKWKQVLELYDKLITVNYSPSVALNRAYAFYKVRGPVAALVEAEKLRMENRHPYYLLLGEICKDIDPLRARLNWERAYFLAKSPSEKRAVREKLDGLPQGPRNRP